MNIRNGILLFGLTVASSIAFGQDSDSVAESIKSDVEAADEARKTVVITGARFSYALIETWINEYKNVNPEVHVVIAPRSVTDPLGYDILAEVYEQDEVIRNTRAYLNIGRYAILPVAATGSPLASALADTGLDADLIKQIFFHDIFADEKHRKLNGIPFTVYTRLQKAGVPEVFSKHFGYDQKDLKGTAIAGADAHLLEALNGDPTGVTYLPLPLIYDRHTRKPVDGLAVLPIDINGNKKISDEEKFYDDLDQLIKTLEAENPRDIRNIPIAYLHLSVDKQHASAEAIDFINWIHKHGRRDLHKFGYLSPEANNLHDESFREFAAGRVDFNNEK